MATSFLSLLDDLIALSLAIFLARNMSRPLMIILARTAYEIPILLLRAQMIEPSTAIRIILRREPDTTVWFLYYSVKMVYIAAAQDVMAGIASLIRSVRLRVGARIITPRLSAAKEKKVPVLVQNPQMVIGPLQEVQDARPPVLLAGPQSPALENPTTPPPSPPAVPGPPPSPPPQRVPAVPVPPAAPPPPPSPPIRRPSPPPPLVARSLSQVVENPVPPPPDTPPDSGNYHSPLTRDLPDPSAATCMLPSPAGPHLHLQPAHLRHLRSNDCAVLILPCNHIAVIGYNVDPCAMSECPVCHGGVEEVVRQVQD